MTANLEERYNTHLAAREIFDETVKLTYKEYSELYDKLSDEVNAAHNRREQLAAAHSAALQEAKDEYKDATGVDPHGPF